MLIKIYKGIWGSYNRRSTVNQPRCQSREGSVVSDTILRRESSKHCYKSQYLETWREPGPNRGAIADQPRTNRGFHRDYLKIDLIWIVRLWTLLFWFFFAIGYHSWTQCLGKPKYNIYIYIYKRLKCNSNIIIMPYNIEFSSYNGRFLRNKCVSQSRTNRDAGFYNRGCWNTHALS